MDMIFPWACGKHSQFFLVLFMLMAYVSYCFSVLLGVLAFLIVEKLVRIYRGPGHGHSHSPPPSPTLEKTPSELGAEDLKSSMNKGDEELSGTQLKQRKVQSKDSDGESENSPKPSKKVRFASEDKIVTSEPEPGIVFIICGTD